MSFKKTDIDYRVGEVYPFTVNAIHDDFCELLDASDFKVFLKGTNRLMLVRGQRIRCRVLKYTKKRPMIEIVDYGGATGESRVGEGVVVELLRGLGATWAVDELATLLMQPERGGSFDDDCRRWIAALRRAGADLEQLRADTTRFMEQSPFLSMCTPLERQLYQARLTALVEWLDCHVTADRLAREGGAAEFVDGLLDKLRLSGYVYRPVWNFNVLSCLFLIDPQLMESRMGKLFDALRGKELEMWKDEPLNSVITKTIQLYIDHDIWTVDRLRDNAARVDSMLQALAIQLKLLGRETSDEQFRLDLSRLSTLSTYVGTTDGKRTLALSLANLLGAQPQVQGYSWADTGSRRVAFIYSQAQAPALDTESCYVFDRGRLSISEGRMALELGRTDKPRETLPAKLGLWGGLQVVADRNDLPALSAQPSIAECRTFWQNVERTIFDPAPVAAAVRGKTRRQHHVGDIVTIAITRQDASEQDLFHAEIVDDDMGGQGWLRTEDIVPYTARPNLLHFRWRNGHRMHLEAEIIDRDENDLFHFSMLDTIRRYIIDNVVEEGQEVEVSLGSEPPRNSRKPAPGVTTDGISVSLTGFDEVDCSGMRRGQVLRARYLGEASEGFILKCAVVGKAVPYKFNDVSPAFLHLMETVAFSDEEEEQTDDDNSEAFEKSDRILDPTHMRELVRIVDRMSVLDNEYVKSYNYLGFARTLCRLIDWKEQAAYYSGRMELIVMLHDFATNGSIDEARLESFADGNAELFHGNALLRNRFLQLQMVSFMRRADRDTELWQSYQENSGLVKDVAQLVIAYNMLWRSNMRTQANDIQNRIMKTLRLEGYESGLKIYGSGIEDQVTEYKTSIVFPPNTMLPDMERQLHNILAVIASFLNTEGGTLYIGVNDSGAGVGIADDLDQPPFHGDKDKYQRTIIDAVSLTWGNSVATYIHPQFDTDNADKDVLIITVRPFRDGVELDGACPVRVGSTKRRLTLKEFTDLKLSRTDSEAATAKATAAETAEAQAAIAHAAAPEAVPAAAAPTAATVAPVAKPAEKLATSLSHPNVLLDYEPDYREFIACLRLLGNGKFQKLPAYYDDPQDALTIAVYDEDQDGFLMLGYTDGTITKVPVRELMRMNDYQEYSRYTGTKLVFATIAHNTDAMVSVTTENKNHGRKMVRADRIGLMPEGKIADRGARPYNDGLVRDGVAFEIVPSDDFEPLKNILDRDARSLGFPIRTVPAEIAEVLARHGVK